MREYYRHEVYLSRRKLRTMSAEETLVVRGLSGRAVSSARVTCSQVGRERGCYFSLSVDEATDEAGGLTVRVTRMTRAAAQRRGLLRGPAAAAAADEPGDGDVKEDIRVSCEAPSAKSGRKP